MNSYTDGLEAGRHWPAPAPQPETTHAPAEQRRQLATCPRCGHEHDPSIHQPEADGRTRCPHCAALTHPDEIPSPVTATDALERGRRAANNH